MKHFLSLLLVLFTFLNASTQKAVDFKAALHATKLEEVTLNGISLGIVHTSDWSLEYDFLGQTQTPHNLPKRYNGRDLNESYSYHSLSIGKGFSLFEQESLRLITKVGLHKGSYKGYDNYVILPKEDDLTVAEALGSGIAGILLLPIALTDHLNQQSHSYEEVNEKLFGVNGEVLLEYQFNNRLVISAGGKWIKDKRTSDFGPVMKLGVQF